MNEQHSIDALAGEYVVGTLAGIERERFETRLRTDAEAADAVAAWRRRLAPLDVAVRPAEPPPEIWDAIKARITAESMPEDMLTLRADEGEWETLGPGVAIKNLHFDEETGARSYLARFEPGATYEPHDHPGDEECLMLSGEVSFGELKLKAGDYHLARKGTRHAAAHSATGGVLFVRVRAA